MILATTRVGAAVKEQCEHRGISQFGAPKVHKGNAFNQGVIQFWASPLEVERVVDSQNQQFSVRNVTVVMPSFRYVMQSIHASILRP